MLREKNVFDINDVETAIIEANGALSVLKSPQKIQLHLKILKYKTKCLLFPSLLS